MRTQTIAAISVTTTTDDYGDSTTTQTEQQIAGVLFEPQQGTERTDSRSPGVITPAKFYLPVALQLNADDVILDSAEVPWEVIAGSSVWQDQTEVAVRRAD